MFISDQLSRAFAVAVEHNGITGATADLVDGDREAFERVPPASSLERIDQRPPAHPGERSQNPEHQSDPVESDDCARVAADELDEQLLETLARGVGAQVVYRTLRDHPASRDDADVRRQPLDDLQNV